MSTRQRALVLLVLGAVCLAPVLAITVAYYSHIFSSPWGVSQDWSILALMGLMYLSMIGGPLLVTALALVMLASAQASPVVLRWILIGGTMSAAWATFFVGANPPDIPVRVVAWLMGSCSIVVVVVSYRWLRRLTPDASLLSESPSRPTKG